MTSDEIKKITIYKPDTTDKSPQIATSTERSQNEDLPSLLALKETEYATHIVASGEYIEKIARKYSTTRTAIIAANPQIEDFNKIYPGQTINIPQATNKYEVGISTTNISAESKSNNSEETPAMKQKGIITLNSYNENLSQEIRDLKPILLNFETKKNSAYFSANGKLTIGIGHQLTEKNKPQFLKEIESLKPATKDQQNKYDEINKNPNLSDGEKKKQILQIDYKRKKSIEELNTSLNQALQNEENAKSLQLALKKDLDDAVKETKIQNIATSVSNKHILTEEQIQLLFNSDIKKAADETKRLIGETAYNKATTGQKQVAIDIQYNTGSLKNKTPNFLKFFKEGKMDKAQAELDIFKADGKIELGLIIRNYKRMLLMNKSGTICDKAKEKLLNAYNIDRKNKHANEAKTFEEALIEIGQ